MDLSHHDIKAVVYIADTLFGVILIIAGWHFLSLAGEDLLGYGISGLVLFVLGAFQVFFGFETYLLRDDADIWQ